METNKELINSARRHKEERGSANVNNGRGFCGNCSQSWPCITRRLADALEAATAEPEWEYGRDCSPYGVDEWDSEQAARVAVQSWRGSSLVRRRPAGPWLPVEGESSDEA